MSIYNSVHISSNKKHLDVVSNSQCEQVLEVNPFDAAAGTFASRRRGVADERRAASSAAKG
jgi:tetrahydromethanopterin S-methyltransferase subunit H